jgi:hypothetical protein
LDFQGLPQQRAEHRERERQVQCETIGAYCDLVRAEAGLDHEPANCALQSDQRSDDEQRHDEVPGYAACDQETEQRQHVGEANDTAELPMAPFPPVDRFERVEAHARIDELILRDRPILGERHLPVGVRQRRNGAQDRAPLGDGEAAPGQARRAADANDHDDEGCNSEQPRGDSAMRGQRASAIVIEPGDGDPARTLPRARGPQAAVARCRTLP